MPWRPIAVGTPGPEFEARPPGRYAFEFPDTECDGWSTPSLCLRFASVRGAQHRYSGKPRQDAARAACHEASGSVVFAVADGVSGARRPEFGAIEACRTSVERMLHLLSAGDGPLDFRDVLLRAAERLRQLAQWWQGGREPEPGEVADMLATTLVAGVVRPDPAGPVAELCRVGDSGAWVLDRAAGRYQALFGAKTGSGSPVVSNAVTPLPHVPDPLERTVVRLAAPHTLLVGTDGFGDPLGDGDGQVGALFARQLATPVSPPWFAHLLDFSRETFDDDRTLLAVWPHPGAPAT
ncbi:protein phosphatase 2C domain-containing protein [Streptomyces sennicomposti]|uniref:protein phosphatase 2C domain-containing protein n=1 Tax=Streptomyces sennicomposti TaxID=2873384 RepID=UPI001CA79986|nr:protein phosphatase 2C domain-containing protein [Streptomyces sennicomposti]MBY8869660.1 protein phosphatase 2C domain-containing protein [Streptomyces sennicomposti]